MGEPTVRSTITTITVSAIPEAARYREAYLWDVVVEQRAPGQWAVSHMSRCLSDKGEWDYEPIPSSRSDEWKAAHRWDRATAMRLARRAAPTIVVNGRTPAEYMAWADARTEGGTDG